MSIKRRLISSLTVIAVVYVLLTVTITRVGMLPAFSTIEREFAEQNAGRVNQFINSELDRLERFVIDWAQWTETRDYLLGENPTYIGEHITFNAASNINADILMFFDTENNLVWGGVYDFETLDNLPIADFFELPFSDSPDIFSHSEILASTSGLVGGPGQTLLLSSRPILDSEMNGPIAGTLVIGRVLDDRFLSDLKKDLALDVKIFHVGSDPQTNGFSSLWGSFKDGLDVSFIEADSETRHLVKYYDIYGQPVLISELNSPRTIVDIGRETVFTSIIFLIIALSLLILAIWVLLEKHVLLPLGQLKNHMHKMQLDEDLTQHIAITTTDEFGDIGRELNELITTLNNSRKDSEAARNTAIAASKSKSDFLATMSHEIRTPMNGVLGMADLLLASKPLSDEQEQWVRTINHSGNALLKILNDILDFSKIEAGKFILEDTSFNFGKMLEDSAELLAYDIQSKGLELLVDFSPSLFCDFMGDAGRLRQIILNLLSNASKFTTAGSIRLCASEISVEGENYIRIEVQDTGIGIQDGNQEHLFNSFTQEDASTTRKFGGTGLGLAVTKQLTELMGGNVGFSSSYGKGSTFWVQIPLKATSDLTAIKQNEFKGSLAIVYILDQAVTEIMISRLQYWGVCVRVITAPGEIVQIAKHIAKPGLVGKPQFFIDAKLLSVVVCKELSLLRGALSGAAFKLVFLNPLALHFSAQSLQSLGGNSLLPTPVKIGALAFYFLPPD